MTKLIRGLILCMAIFAMSAPAHARLTALSKVRYGTLQGQSKWYSVEVNFLTGYEFQQATGDWSRYDFFKNYAVIFWAKDQATVIEISTTLLCGGDFSQSCLPILGRIKGKDQDGDQWEVCTATMCV